MKFSILPIAATATLFSSAVASDDALLASTLALSLADQQDFLRPGHLLVLDDVSAQCKAELEELTQNSDLMAKFESLNQACPVTSSGNQINQDFGPCDKGEVQLACTAAGGKRWWHVSHLCSIIFVCRF